MKLKRICVFVLTLVVLLTSHLNYPVNTYADGETETQITKDNITYELSTAQKDGNMVHQAKVVDSYVNLSGEVEIPATITSNGVDYTVNIVGKDAFRDRMITKITLPDSIETIEKFAFDGCFIREFYLPASVTELGEAILGNCINLEKIVVDSQNKVFDSRDNCNAIIKKDTNELVMGCNATVIPDSVKIINGNSFLGTTFDTILIPEGVEKINSFAFQSSKISKVILPATLKSIRGDSFNRCDELQIIQVAAGNTKYDSRNDCNAVIETATNTLVMGCASTVIPDSVKKLGAYCFMENHSVISVMLPNGLEEISTGAFRGCSNLKELTIPKGVKKISGWDLTAFCKKIEILSVEEENEYYDSRNNCNAIIETATDKLIAACNYTKIPDGIKVIGKRAFLGFEYQSICLPDSVVEIENSAFATNYSLKALVIPESVGVIGKDIFSYINTENITIFGVPGSYAETYAKENSIKFADIKTYNENNYENPELKAENESDEETEQKADNGWDTVSGSSYWYENGVKQGTYDDPNGVIGDGTVRGREIYDPVSDGWYWLDACYDGAKAVSKEVWMPYIYQGNDSWDDAEIAMNASNSGDMAAQVTKAIKERLGKWVRYDANGKMYKGWYTVNGSDAEIYPYQTGNTYYYDKMTGLMAKGTVMIDGKEYKFDEITGALITE